MNAVFLDSSVILRHVLGEPQAHPMVKQLDQAWASELLRVEALRTLDRLRLLRQWSDEIVAMRIRVLTAVMAPIREVPIQAPILRQAAQPFPTMVGTLDAIHIATAVLMQYQLKQEVLLLTHDRRQGTAALAMGLQAEGF